MKLSQSKVSILNIIIILLMMAVSLISYFSFLSLQKESNFIVDDTIPVVRASQNLLNDLINEETGIRGYLISEDKKFLEPYLLGLSDLDKDIATIQAYATTNSTVLTGLLTLKALPKINTIQSYYKDQIARVESGQMQEARIRINDGKMNMDQFRDFNTDIVNEVARITSASRTKANDLIGLSRLIIVLGIIISIIAGIISILMYKRAAKAEKALQENAENLEQQNEEIISQHAEQEEMMRKLTEIIAENEQQYWLKTQFSRLTGLSQGMNNLQQLVKMLISEIAKSIEAGHGVCYVKEIDKKSKHYGEYILLGSYAYKERNTLSTHFKPGEGLVGQCALEKKPIRLSNVPSDYVQIQSGLGESRPLTLIVLPILYEDEAIAVIELASFQVFTQTQLDLLDQLSVAFGVIIDSVISRQRTEALLLESQELTEELQSQQEQLRASNEELEEQTQMLKRSEEKLRIQSNELEHKAHELELASQYKSQFLANMSHELRTPLNSLLILSKSLAGNAEANLTEDQIESAKIIYSGGLDLLTLINDILDLSKVEAGKLDIQPEAMRLEVILNDLRNQFSHVAQDKGLEFVLDKDDQLPDSIVTDGQRAEQILKNLLSNAFKFTSKGTISLRIQHPVEGTRFINSQLAGKAIAFIVRDTGIGIPLKKQQAIFEAFQQADGSTSRRYGGTGLGLTISRELAKLLGGEIHLESREEAGSSFTLLLPLDAADLPHRDDALQKALPAVELNSERMKQVLVIEDEAINQKAIYELLKHTKIEIDLVYTGQEGLAKIKSQDYDCVILDLRLPDMTGFDLLEQLVEMKKANIPPIIINTGKDLTPQEYKALYQFTDSIVIKGVNSPERLLDEVSLFLHSIHKQLTPEQKQMNRMLFDSDETIKGRKILLVDDDLRNTFALSKILKQHGLEVIMADNGKLALEKLESERNIALVIIDMMMPIMDGYEAMRRIREQDQFHALPIIALTAKAMTGDREKCIEGGANDYMTKPVDTDHLLSLIRVWLFNKNE
jgi:signal transduction histidine kinase/CheY-like chemotaxis protein/CHASE3 domain sensor protein